MNFHQKPITFVSNITIKVENIDRSIAFYKNIVGFNVLKRTETSAELTADGITGILTVEQPEAVLPKQGRTTGLYHFAILLPSRKDLANFVYHTVDVGLELGASDHLVSEALYFSDPDGNGIEVYQDRDPSTWTWNGDHVNMAVDPLDFEDLLQEGERGAWQGLPKQTVMGHIHLHVADIPTTKHFYEKGLGFETVSQFGNQALFISKGKYHHHIGLNTWNGVGALPPAENSAGLKHFTLTYADHAVEDVVKQLRAIGAIVEQKDGKASTVDPSGNIIILSY
ncbi:VOC family protein [Gracilibacillus caseinilyticus]|uniref:VOC family protein n=1 Tax=Gracilibacillus caseinilyticus TaxID=2932256 RepID=A0ABY4EX39_9BACI|nr:VOC family protein [Gracilibacillus caseinilyticus]UOQ48982.1 VOC family protein [Gracilibacillus caseinilyticus]